MSRFSSSPIPNSPNLWLAGYTTQPYPSSLSTPSPCRPDANPAPASLRILLLFTPLFLSGAPLLKLPSTKLTPLLDPSQTTFRADASKLSSLIPTLREFYSYFLSLPAQEINAFMGQEWGSFILVIILGFRMCFPMAICPEWDDKLARERIGMGEFLGKMCGDAAGEEGGKGKGTSMDVLSASRIVLGVVKKKFDRRVQRVEREQREEQERQRGLIGRVVEGLGLGLGGGGEGQVAGGGGGGGGGHDGSIGGCPMMDGSMEGYYAYWDETFADTAGLGGGGFQGPNVGPMGGGETTTTTGGIPQQQQAMPQVSGDLWGTMTMAWAQGGMTFDGMGQ